MNPFLLMIKWNTWFQSSFLKANFTLWVFVYHVIHFNHIYLPTPSTRIPPRSTPFLSPFKLHVLLFFPLWPTKSSLHQSCADACGAVLWGIVHLPGALSLEKTDCLWFLISKPVFHYALLLMPLLDPGDFLNYLFTCLFSWGRVSVCRPGWPWSHSDSPSQVLGFWTCATIPNSSSVEFVLVLCVHVYI